MSAVTLKQLKQQLKQALSQQTKRTLKEVDSRLEKQSKNIFKEVSGHLDRTVLPQIDKLAKKVNKIENTMATKDDIDRIERKLVKKDDTLDKYGGKIDNHERRITSLETKTSMSS